MMMKRLLIFLFVFTLTASVHADNVSQADAEKVAQAFMPGEKIEVQNYTASSGRKSAQVPFYIFNKVDGTGFVLISADDRTTPVLGYSLNGSIDQKAMPSNLRYWLDSYASQIQALDKDLKADDLVRNSTPLSNIDPLIQSKWNQNGPYDLMCPDANGTDYNNESFDSNNRCVTGCVATAVAQVMCFHQWPLQTTSIPAYNLVINGNKVTLAELPATTLEWDKMKDSYNKADSDESAYAVAKLMRYVGQAFKMYYDIAANGGSGANISSQALIEYFAYSKKIHTRDRDKYTTSQWESMIYEELRNNRPVLYGGYTKDYTGGHQFICDGYKDGLFHLNWGWGGRLDGFFVLSVADPKGEQGIGGSDSGFSYGQDAVFNFMPAEANEEETPQLRSVANSKFPTSDYFRSSASEDFTGISLPNNFQAMYEYQPVTTFAAEVGWGLYEGEQLVKMLGYSEQTIDHRQRFAHYYYSYNNNIDNIPIDKTIENGCYQLRQLFRKAGTEDEWTLLDNYGSNYLLAEIKGSCLRVRLDQESSVIMSGDVNNDGRVSTTDMISTIGFLLGDTPKPFYYMAADVNQDGNISVADVSKLVDKVLDK